jgi:peptidoglycan hydrolase CwlO-like protein
MISKIILFLKVNYPTILKVLFGLFILYYLIFFLTPRVNMTVSQKQQLDSLNIVIKQLHQDNLKLEDKISDFNNQIEEVDNNINKIKGQKTVVKEIYHEKISNVDKLSIPEIDSFFTDRYK